MPFDANISANGALSGGGQMGHRVMAIGHDPILGLIFGTLAAIFSYKIRKLDFKAIEHDYYGFVRKINPNSMTNLVFENDFQA